MDGGSLSLRALLLPLASLLQPTQHSWAQSTCVLSILRESPGPTFQSGDRAKYLFIAALCVSFNGQYLSSRFSVEVCDMICLRT